MHHWQSLKLLISHSHLWHSFDAADVPRNCTTWCADISNLILQFQNKALRAAITTLRASFKSAVTEAAGTTSPDEALA